MLADSPGERFREYGRVRGLWCTIHEPPEELEILRKRFVLAGQLGADGGIEQPQQGKERVLLARGEIEHGGSEREHCGRRAVERGRALFERALQVGKA